MGFVSKLFKAGKSVVVQSRREDRAQGRAAHKAHEAYLKKHGMEERKEKKRAEAYHEKLVQLESKQYGYSARKEVGKIEVKRAERKQTKMFSQREPNREGFRRLFS